MASNLSAEMSRIMSKAVRQGFSFEYMPPDFPGDVPMWAVRSIRPGRFVVRVDDVSLTEAYVRWAELNGLSTEPE